MQRLGPCASAKEPYNTQATQACDEGVWCGKSGGGIAYP